MLDQIQQWYIEAATLHGDDWPKIERYVERKMAAVNPADRRKLFMAFEVLFPCQEASLPH